MKYQAIYRPQSYKHLLNISGSKYIFGFLRIFMLISLIVMFLPWTQNIATEGRIIAINPDQRPQNIQTFIPGRITKWYVKEGDLVKKGDTIIFITEVKDKYLDPELIAKTRQQLDAKIQSADSYSDKIRAIDQQTEATINLQQIKTYQAKNFVEQSRLKVQADSIDLQAAITNLQTEDVQLKRMEQLYNAGLKSLTDLELKRQKYQDALAKKISAEAKFLSSKNQLINAIADLSAIETEFREKINKLESDKFSTYGNLFDTNAMIAKMSNEYSNLVIRNNMYYILAPQDGYITKVTRTGIGEIVKENEILLTIMPAKYDLGAEFFIEPIDLPLVHKYQHVQVMFDGWPTIVFSGWPGVSHGTFEAKVIAIDQYISENGKYRIIVAPKTDNYPWPDALRVGTGAKGFILLKDVPIWYEAWRKFNGFPPDFYTGKVEEVSDKKSSDKSETKEE